MQKSTPNGCLLETNPVPTTTPCPVLSFVAYSLPANIVSLFPSIITMMFHLTVPFLTLLSLAVPASGGYLFPYAGRADFSKNGLDRRIVEECFKHREVWQYDPYNVCHDIIEFSKSEVSLKNIQRNELYYKLLQQDESDRQLVFECFRKVALDQNTRSEECASISWGSQLTEENARTVREYRIALHVENATEDLSRAELCLYHEGGWVAKEEHYCNQLIGVDINEANLTPRQLRQRSLYKALLERDASDRERVRHCANYHQFFSVDFCRGITWSKGPKRFSVKRQARIDALSAENFKSKYETAVDSDRRLLVTCLYSNAWVTAYSHNCRSMLNLKSSEILSAAHLLRLYTLFKQMKETDLVTDCFEYHREDQFPGCYGVSWDIVKRNSTETFLPQTKEHRLIWANLLKLEKCK